MRVRGTVIGHGRRWMTLRNSEQSIPVEFEREQAEVRLSGPEAFQFETILVWAVESPKPSHGCVKAGLLNGGFDLRVEVGLRAKRISEMPHRQS